MLYTPSPKLQTDDACIMWKKRGKKKEKTRGHHNILYCSIKQTKNILFFPSSTTQAPLNSFPSLPHIYAYRRIPVEPALYYQT